MWFVVPPAVLIRAAAGAFAWARLCLLPLKGATEVVKVEVKERNIDQLMEQQPVMWWVLLHLLELNTGAFFATFNHEILEMER